MEKQKTTARNKGGRPKKAVKKDQLLAVKCSLVERKVIVARAKSAGLSVSEYLREIAMTGKIERHDKALPKEVLVHLGTINHVASNINQIAKKRNGFDELNAMDRAELKVLAGELKALAPQIKSYLQ
jgi:hypothetical protein